MSDTRTELTRRSFLKGSSGAIAAAALGGPTIVSRSAFGANEKIRLAVLGVNGRGKEHIQRFMEVPGAEVVCLCDPDSNVLGQRASQFEMKYGKKVQTVQDLRRVFDDKGIDAVTVATP